MGDKISRISKFRSEASKYTNEVNVILKDVLAKIKPSADLKAQNQNTAKSLITEIKKKFNHEAVIVGSIAKDTDLAYTAYDTDIDIFIKFPVRFKKEELGKKIIEIGEKILINCEIDYAEHPYVKGKFKNFSIELVPCYDFGEGIFGDFKNIATSVDRTIYHTKYVKEKIKSMKNLNLNDEIRLLKQFMKGCNVYGAEASVKGFSGYLAELMCIYYGSFIEIIKYASEWKLNTFIDVENQWEGQGKILFDEPLIVIDPIDKNRNVASAVSDENMAKFIYACRKFLLSPSIDFFIVAEKKEKRTTEEILLAIKERRTKFIAISYKHQYININNLYSQLEKTRKTLIKQTEKFKFCVMNSKSYTTDSVINGNE
ncbi:MAG: CCA tRNA nucleotidyltransferase [Candidatus Altarchaeum sp.]|nr:CCA tRNA nucleotidyltransferase [Candidatus Altarchaeum sp.]